MIPIGNMGWFDSPPFVAKRRNDGQATGTIHSSSNINEWKSSSTEFNIPWPFWKLLHASPFGTIMRSVRGRTRIKIKLWYGMFSPDWWSYHTWISSNSSCKWVHTAMVTGRGTPSPNFSRLSPWQTAAPSSYSHCQRHQRRRATQPLAILQHLRQRLPTQHIPHSACGCSWHGENGAVHRLKLQKWCICVYICRYYNV